MTRQLPRPCIGNGTRPCRYRALAHVGSRCQRCRSEYNTRLKSSSQRRYDANQGKPDDHPTHPQHGGAA
jgi:hypothetical protein